MYIKKNKLTEENKKNYRNVFIIVGILMFVFFIEGMTSSVSANTGENFTTAFNELSDLINKISNFMLGISILSAIGTTIYHLIKLGSAGANPQARAKVFQDMLTTVICIALLGSINLAISLITMWFM